MKKMPLKFKAILVGNMFLFMIIYMIVFGRSNAAIGLTMAMAAFMNLGNDMSYKPKISFLKVSILLLILGIGAYLNNPLSILGCILTFFIVFGTTFSSYHLFGRDVYLPYLMAYFMMFCIPVSLGDLPMRLISLMFGSVFIVGLNILVNRKKDRKLSKETICSLIEEIDKAIDLKLEGKEVSKESFKTANGFYSSLFNKFEYKYLPSPRQESVLNIVKAFQYIGVILADFDLSKNELNYLKKTLDEILEINPNDICESVNVETDEMYLVLLNLEIIADEIKNKDFEKESAIPEKKSLRESFKPFLKYQFSFRSAKFTFAFKMAVILTLWVVLTFIFDLPYTKWLYFASIPLMQPYVDDMEYQSKSRIQGTLIGAFIFMILVLIYPHSSLSVNSYSVIVMIICMFGMIFWLEEKRTLTIFTTLMSISMSLMYISPNMAITLKVLWVVVGAIVVSIFNFGFLPYSVEKETKNNLAISCDLNKKSIGLIKKRCLGKEYENKNSLLVLSSIVRENIEVTDDNRELFELQVKITDICNFILSYMDIYEFSDDLKSKMINVIDGKDVKDSDEIKDTVIIRSMKYVKKLFNTQNQLIN